MLALKITAKAVSAKDLQHTEEDKEAQARAELRLINLHEWTQIVQINTYQFLAQFGAVVRRSLPKETGEVILQGTTPASLEINKMRIPRGG